MTGNERIVALVPARLDSTRLPYKQLRPIAGRAMLWYLLERLNAVEALDDVIVATTDRDVDELLVQWAESHGTPVYRGAHEDVLARLYRAADDAGADVVVRANGDNPLISPAVTRNGIDQLTTTDLEFATGKHKYTGLPVGLGPELLRTETLARILDSTAEPSHREHVTTYIFDNPDEFDWASIPVKAAWKASNLSLTIDMESDLRYVRRVVASLPDCHPTAWAVEDIIDASHAV